MVKISKVQLTIGSKLGGKLGIFSERLSNSNCKEEKRNQYVLEEMLMITGVMN